MILAVEISRFYLLQCIQFEPVARVPTSASIASQELLGHLVERPVISITIEHPDHVETFLRPLGGKAFRGVDGLKDGKAPGQTPKLNEAQRRALVAMVEAGPIPAIHGVVRWRLIDLAQWVYVLAAGAAWS